MARKKQPKKNIFITIILALLVAVIVAALAGYFYIPEGYSKYYLIAVGLLVLNLLMAYYFVRRNIRR